MRKSGVSAEDVDIARINVLQLFDGCTSTTDTTRFTAVMEYVVNATERYDIAGFFAYDGGTARTGQCYHNFMNPPLAAAPNHKPKSGVGPFLNAETSDTADICGDIRSKDGSTLQNVDLFYNQLGADSGPGASLGAFQSRVIGVGPQAGYSFAVGGLAVDLGLRGYKEFDAVNRPEGWNFWVTVAVSRPRRHAAR